MLTLVHFTLNGASQKIPGTWKCSVDSCYLVSLFSYYSGILQLLFSFWTSSEFLRVNVFRKAQLRFCVILNGQAQRDSFVAHLVLSFTDISWPLSEQHTEAKKYIIRALLPLQCDMAITRRELNCVQILYVQWMGFGQVFGATPGWKCASLRLMTFHLLEGARIEVAQSNLEPVIMLWFSWTSIIFKCCWRFFSLSNVQNFKRFFQYNVFKG